MFSTTNIEQHKKSCLSKDQSICRCEYYDEESSNVSDEYEDITDKNSVGSMEETIDVISQND